MSCVNCGNDDGTQMVCLDCLELIGCKCNEIQIEKDS
jgi:hypothetical protein